LQLRPHPSWDANFCQKSERTSAASLRPDLYLGEAYMDGSLSIDRGSLWELLDLIGRNPSQASRPGGPWRRADKSIAHERPAAYLQAAE